MTTEIYLSAEETATRLDINVKTFRKYFAASSIDAATNGTAHPVTTVMQGRKTLYSWLTVQLWWDHIETLGTQQDYPSTFLLGGA